MLRFQSLEQHRTECALCSCIASAGPAAPPAAPLQPCLPPLFCRSPPLPPFPPCCLFFILASPCKKCRLLPHLPPPMSSFPSPWCTLPSASCAAAAAQTVAGACIRDKLAGSGFTNNSLGHFISDHFRTLSNGAVQALQQSRLINTRFR